MIRTEGVELTEGNIVDVQDSYKYLGRRQLRGQIPAEGEAGPEESAKWEKQDPVYQQL